jgi:hypothetical protein
MFKLFEVKEGKLKVLPAIGIKNIKGFFIGSIVIIIIASLSGWMNINEKELWKIYHLLIERLNLKQEIPEIIDNQKRIDAKVELEVDMALTKVIPEYDRIINEADKKYKPIYNELDIDKSVCYTDECKSLGGEMRLCAPWVDSCNKQ